MIGGPIIHVKIFTAAVHKRSSQSTFANGERNKMRVFSEVRLHDIK